MPVSETTYRYDGPRPQFKESAIILLADSCEAAESQDARPGILSELQDLFQREPEGIGILKGYDHPRSRLDVAMVAGGHRGPHGRLRAISTGQFDQHGARSEVAERTELLHRATQQGV